VGYRVNSAQATRFRIWATQTLREFVRKGFVLDDERLKLNSRFGKDYFDALLKRIREIRASERRFYLKITDIYEQRSADYDAAAAVTKRFFQTVQNKLHWAVTGKTAAEIIAERADASKPSMGLTTWRNAPPQDPEVRRLRREELSHRAGDRGARPRRRDVPRLRGESGEAPAAHEDTDAGTVSAEVARQLAEGHYDAFRVQQDRRFESDFEREVKQIAKDSTRRPRGAK